MRVRVSVLGGVVVLTFLQLGVVIVYLHDVVRHAAAIPQRYAHVLRKHLPCSVSQYCYLYLYHATTTVVVLLLLLQLLVLVLLLVLYYTVTILLLLLLTFITCSSEFTTSSTFKYFRAINELM